MTTEVGTDFTAISITTSNTPVEVRYDDVAEARIIEHRRRGSDRLEHRVTDDRLVVEYRSGGFVFGPSRERLEVVLPQEMSSETPGLMVRTSNGSVAADGRFGSVELTATTGSVDARGTFETVRAHTTTGSVDILGTARDATAQTTTGSVDVEVEDSRTVSARTTTGSVDINVQGAQPAQVQARASTGSVDIEVPNGAYAVDAKSGTGSADVTVDVDPTSTHRIDAETSTGSIDIF